MPVQLTKEPEVEDTDVEFDESTLYDKEGKLTLEAETLATFLEDISYDDLFDDPELEAYVSEETILFREGDDPERALLIPLSDEAEEAFLKKLDAAAEGEDPDPSVVALDCETLPGEVVAEVIDTDDLMEMLKHYVVHEWDISDLSDQVAFADFADMLDDVAEEDLDEKKSPFKKGSFRKAPMKGVSVASTGSARKVHNQRVRMMMAMLKKGVITRVAKGKGYKGGDYKKGPGYAKGGTASGRKAHAKIAAKSKKRAASIKKLVTPGRLKIVKVIYKNLGAKMPKPWIPPEKRAAGKGLKKAVGKKGEAKKKALKAVGGKFAAKAKGKKAAIAASTDFESGSQFGRMTETAGPALASAIVDHQKRIPIEESVGTTPSVKVAGVKIGDA